MHRYFVSGLALVIAGCQTMASPEISTAEVSSATRGWAAAFNECNSNKAASLYDSDAILWGTVSPTIITTSSGVRQYFERACATSPQPKVVLGDQRVRVYGDTAINSGTYTFTIFVGGQPRQNPARFSFTYRKKDGQWVILDHHSSAIPAPPPSAPAR